MNLNRRKRKQKVAENSRSGNIVTYFMNGVIHISDFSIRNYKEYQVRLNILVCSV